MRDITLTLTMRQTSQGQTEINTYTYSGKAVQKETGWYLSYREEMEGVGEVSTILKIAEAELTLIRQGKLQMKQEFQKGQSKFSSYASPYGNFLMETHTHKLIIDREDKLPIHVQMEYQMWLSEQYVGEYQCDLKIAWN